MTDHDDLQPVAPPAQASGANAMTAAEFEQTLPEYFSAESALSMNDPRLQAFLAEHPSSAALVRDLEYIAEQARMLFEPVHEPAASVWSNIKEQLAIAPAEESASATPAKPLLD